MRLMGRVPGMPPQFAGAFGFVRAPFEHVSGEIFTWHTELGFRPRSETVKSGLAHSAGLLLPLSTTPYARSLVVGTRSGEWTAYFDASTRGGDPRGAVSVLGRRLGAPSVVVYAIPLHDDPHAVPGLFGAAQLEYAPDGQAQNGRAISLVEGEGTSPLHFEARGPVQDWETPALYTVRTKRKRFNAETIDAYCRALGIEPFDLNYYSGPSLLVERTA